MDVTDMKAKGEEMKRFLLKRNLVLESIGINAGFFKMEEEIIQDLFPSPWLNECINKWTEDLLRDQFENINKRIVREGASS